MKNWIETEYAVTDQRVFFDTLIGYAIVNLTDVREVYVKTGLFDIVFGTGSVFVSYRDFQPTTKFWSPDAPRGELVIHHKHPSFQSIKETSEVQRIIQEAADRAQRSANPSQEPQ